MAKSKSVKSKSSSSTSSLRSQAPGKTISLSKILNPKRAKTRPKRPRKEAKLPGTIYLNKNRYWWKVKLPGEAKIKARPLRPVGAKYATKDIGVAKDLATNMLHQALFCSQKEGCVECDGSVMSIVKAFCDHARNYYKDVDGNIATEAKRIEYATKPLVELYATLDAEEFGPLKLKQVRQRMIELDLARKTINDRIACIKRMFRWAASEELVSAGVYQAMITVEGLKRGRSGARETKKVLPVPETHVYAVLG